MQEQTDLVELWTVVPEDSSISAILVLFFHGYSSTAPAEMFGPLLLLFRSFDLGLQATDHPDPAALQKVQAAEPGAVDSLTGEPTYRVRTGSDIPKLRAI